MSSEDGRNVLETSKADRSVWLMKCPPVVSRSWQAAASSSSSADPSAAHPVVAKVVLSLDPLNNDESSSLQFKMELAQNEIGNTPKSCSLNMFKDFVPMCVFSESNQGTFCSPSFLNCHCTGSVGAMLMQCIAFRQHPPSELFCPLEIAVQMIHGMPHNCAMSKRKFSLEGKVEHKFDMEPHSENFGEYGKLCRERTNKAMIKTRQVLVIGNDYGENMRPLPGMVGLVPAGSKEKKKVPPAKGSETKRTRRDRRELENIIFKLFERQPNWALKALVKETDQPEQFLKEILNDLCDYNKRGPNQGTHELKPEYKKTNEEMDTSS